MSGSAFVLIPGAGGAAWYWHRVVAELHRRGRQAIAVDLPAEDDTAGLQEYVQIVVEAADGLDDVVVVGQSMGALTAPIAAARLPASLLVLVNAMVPRPGETGHQWWVATGHEQALRENDAREGRRPAEGFDVDRYFLHDLPEPLRQEALRGDRAQSVTPFTTPWPLPRWPDVPTRVVTGHDDRFFPRDFQRRVSQERLGIAPDVVPGGHLVALSRPVELVGQLLADRRDASRAGTAT